MPLFFNLHALGIYILLDQFFIWKRVSHPNYLFLSQMQLVAILPVGFCQSKQACNVLWSGLVAMDLHLCCTDISSKLKIHCIWSDSNSHLKLLSSVNSAYPFCTWSFQSVEPNYGNQQHFGQNRIATVSNYFSKHHVFNSSVWCIIAADKSFIFCTIDVYHPPLSRIQFCCSLNTLLK